MFPSTVHLTGAKFGNHDLTRCIGNYFMKGGYKEFDILSSATSEPVIAEPHITCLPIDESCRYAVLNLSNSDEGKGRKYGGPPLFVRFIYCPSLHKQCRYTGNFQHRHA